MRQMHDELGNLDQSYEIDEIKIQSQCNHEGFLKWGLKQALKLGLDAFATSLLQ